MKQKVRGITLKTVGKVSFLCRILEEVSLVRPIYPCTSVKVSECVSLKGLNRFTAANQTLVMGPHSPPGTGESVAWCTMGHWGSADFSHLHTIEMGATLTQGFVSSI